MCWVSNAAQVLIISLFPSHIFGNIKMNGLQWSKWNHGARNSAKPVPQAPTVYEQAEKAHLCSCPTKSGLPWWLNSGGKESTSVMRERPGVQSPGRSPGEGNGHPFQQYSGLENPMGQSSQASYSLSWGHKESDTHWSGTFTNTHTS